MLECATNKIFVSRLIR